LRNRTSAFAEALRLGKRGANQGLSETLYALGKYEECLLHCDKALEREPDLWTLRLRKGLGTGRIEAAGRIDPLF